MRKIFAVFALFCVMFLMIGCGSSSSSDNDSVTNFGKLGRECYPNETCDKGLICDTDNNICVEDPGNPINDSDKTDSGSDEESDTESDSDSGDTIPDGADTTPEQPDNDTDTDSGDTTPDEGDTEPDGGDTESDNDHPQTPDTLTLGNICTGQTSCYNVSSSACPTSEIDDFYGQDAQYTSECTAQSFTASSKVIVDNNTGLTWEKSPSSSRYTWENRNTHCNELNSSNYAGKNNWRVPNPLEFLTIVDNSTYNLAINSNFTNMPTGSSDFLWTNQDYGGDTSIFARAFNPYYGWYSDEESKTSTYKVLCVSGDELTVATSSDFTTSSDGDILTDNRTGLMWQKEHVADKTWQQALKYCENSTYAGYSDWRLPNKNELASLLDPGKSVDPYSNFPDMPSSWFWSSSTYVRYTNNAWYVDFNSGGVSNYNKTYDTYVRCVRNNQ